VKIYELTWIPAKEEPWYLQIKDEIPKSERPIDNMSTKQIRKMYMYNVFLCDSCGKEFDKTNFTLKEHILHLIDPLYYWSCENCFQQDLREGRVIAMENELVPKKDQNI
jgi:hypothetical protein